MKQISQADQIKLDLKKFSNPKKAEFFPYFFKTAEGQYGYGDKFIGVTVPNQRIVAKKFFNQTSFEDLQELLNDEIHEYRLTALIILTYKFKKSTLDQQKEIYEFYLKNTKRINNWDLVDVSCRDIVGAYLFDKDRSRLYKLARSKDLWEQRISIVSTWYFIGKNDFEDVVKISAILLENKHDLIHKAVGWMLREMGKKDEKPLVEFLKKHYKKMPRTMLRYAIEKFDFETRQGYLKGKI